MNVNILILLIMLLKKTDSEQASISLAKATDFINNMEIDHKYTSEKIKLAKKAHQYIPNEYSNTYIKSILLTEKLITILETKKLLNTLTVENYDHVDLSNEERLKGVIKIIQDEKISSSVGIVLDLIINIDNYKNMYKLYSDMIKNKDSLNDPKFLMNMLDSMKDGKSDTQKDTVKDISKIVDMLKSLDINTKNKPNEN